MKVFNYYILEREVKKYDQKVRQFVHIRDDRITLRLNDNFKTFLSNEIIGIPSFINGDILTNSETSTVMSNTFIAIGGNHKYTKVLRMSDGHTVTLPTFLNSMLGSVYESI